MILAVLACARPPLHREDTPEQALSEIRALWMAGDYEAFARTRMDPDVVREQLPTEEALRAWADEGRAYIAERGHPDDVGKLDACLDHGTWRIDGDLAVCDVPELEAHWDPHLRRLDGRWYLTAGDGR